jgi:hypothetical protein
LLFAFIGFDERTQVASSYFGVLRSTHHGDAFHWKPRALEKKVRAMMARLGGALGEPLAVPKPGASSERPHSAYQLELAARSRRSACVNMSFMLRHSEICIPCSPRWHSVTRSIVRSSSGVDVTLRTRARLPHSGHLIAMLCGPG